VLKAKQLGITNRATVFIKSQSPVHTIYKVENGEL